MVGIANRLYPSAIALGRTDTLLRFFIHSFAHSRISVDHISSRSSGEFDVETATLALQQLMYDHYEDDGSIPPGYKFKVSSQMVHAKPRAHFLW